MFLRLANLLDCTITKLVVKVVESFNLLLIEKLILGGDVSSFDGLVSDYIYRGAMK